MASQISDKELKEMGVKREVFAIWEDMMQALWTLAIKFFRNMGEDEKFLPKQGENEIHIGQLYKIDSIICNNDFVETRLWKLGEDMELATIRYDGNADIVCAVIFTIIRLKHK